MQPHPPEPRVVHPLPAAPAFVGRGRELDDLRAAWAGAMPGVVALVGLGGAGKTALAARFLARLGAPRPVGLFVWSFYEQPDAGLFLREAFAYFAGDVAATASPARGAGLLHLLREALAVGGPHLLVLDGLERVQRQGGPDDPGAGEHGRVEDPLLRGLLARLAEGTGRASALVTSRFPMADLEAHRGAGYRPVDVGGLDPGSAVALLRRRGVVGDDAALLGLVEAHGAHALTLDHLGGLIGQFLGGDPARAPEAPAWSSPGSDRQGLRLARLLRAYEEHLPPAELALLCRLCLLRGGVGEGQLLRLFLCAPAVHARVAREAATLVGEIGRDDPHPRDEPLALARAVLEAIEEILSEGPVSGPADEFPAELRRAVDEALARREEAGEVEVEAFLQAYADKVQDAPSERFPLSKADRRRLQFLGSAFRQTRDNPNRPGQARHHDGLAEAFAKLGWDTPDRRIPDDRDPLEIERSLGWFERRIRRLAFKEAILRAVREACRLRRRKWDLAGPLATLDADAVRRVLASLTGRNLVLRESDGAVTVHPAIRDHFAGLAAEGGPGGWHDLIREQLVSLARRPGRAVPEDRATLDLVEEAIHHAREAGRPDEAWALFDRGLGGLRHLGWKLGEMARGLRIVRGFCPCPDRSALAWFLRALGEFDQAYIASPMAFFRADVRLLQGRLPEVAAEGDPARAAVASFLMGESPAGSPPPDLLGLAVPRVQLLLARGKLREARQVPDPGRLYGDIGWEGDRARHRLLLAKGLDAASAWVLRSGSVEHLALWHLVRSRLAGDSGDLAAARRAVDEGVHLARRSGLGLYLILLLNARADILLRGDAGAAAASAEEALALALAPGCRFAWGAAEAGHLLGQALAAEWRFADARAAFAAALRLRRHLDDPGADLTARLLDRLPR